MNSYQSFLASRLRELSRQPHETTDDLEARQDSEIASRREHWAILTARGGSPIGRATRHSLVALVCVLSDALEDAGRKQRELRARHSAGGCVRCDGLGMYYDAASQVTPIQLEAREFWGEMFADSRADERHRFRPCVECGSTFSPPTNPARPAKR